MPIPADSVKLKVDLEFENPECSWEELEPVLNAELDDLMVEIKNSIVTKLAGEAGDDDGGMCHPFRETTFKERTCPKP